ncbi:unnamed protein product [Gordionus sp. m RMFG-2023]
MEHSSSSFLRSWSEKDLTLNGGSYRKSSLLTKLPRYLTKSQRYTRLREEFFGKENSNHSQNLINENQERKFSSNSTSPCSKSLSPSSSSENYFSLSSNNSIASMIDSNNARHPQLIDIDSDRDRLSPDTLISTNKFPTKQQQQNGNLTSYLEEFCSNMSIFKDGEFGGDVRSDESALNKTFDNDFLCYKVIEEMLATEKNYLDDLNVIINGYLWPLYASAHAYGLKKRDIKLIIENLERIRNLNEKFYQNLKFYEGEPYKICTLFIEYSTDFHTAYNIYCQYHQRTLLLFHLDDKNYRKKLLDHFLKQRQITLSHSLPIDSYLLKPIQRILKYPLILKNLEKHYTPQAELNFRPSLSCDESINFDTSKSIVNNAYQHMAKVAHDINSALRKLENLEKVQKLARYGFINWPEKFKSNKDILQLLNSFGELVLDGDLEVMQIKSKLTERQKEIKHGDVYKIRYAFLFEHMLLICKKKRRNYADDNVKMADRARQCYSFKNALPCSNIKIIDSIPKFSNNVTSDNIPVSYESQIINYGTVNYNSKSQHNDLVIKLVLKLSDLNEAYLDHTRNNEFFKSYLQRIGDKNDDLILEKCDNSFFNRSHIICKLKFLNHTQKLAWFQALLECVDKSKPVEQNFERKSMPTLLLPDSEAENFQTSKMVSFVSQNAFEKATKAVSNFQKYASLRRSGPRKHDEDDNLHSSQFFIPPHHSKARNISHNISQNPQKSTFYLKKEPVLDVGTNDKDKNNNYSLKVVINITSNYKENLSTNPSALHMGYNQFENDFDSCQDTINSAAKSNDTLNINSIQVDNKLISRWSQASSTSSNSSGIHSICSIDLFNS